VKQLRNTIFGIIGDRNLEINKHLINKTADQIKRKRKGLRTIIENTSFQEAS
jgi:hypothetical protein